MSAQNFDFASKVPPKFEFFTRNFAILDDNFPPGRVFPPQFSDGAIAPPHSPGHDPTATGIRAAMSCDRGDLAGHMAEVGSGHAFSAGGIPSRWCPH